MRPISYTLWCQRIFSSFIQIYVNFSPWGGFPFFSICRHFAIFFPSWYFLSLQRCLVFITKFTNLGSTYCNHHCPNLMNYIMMLLHCSFTYWKTIINIFEHYFSCYNFSSLLSILVQEHSIKNVSSQISSSLNKFQDFNLVHGNLTINVFYQIVFGPTYRGRYATSEKILSSFVVKSFFNHQNISIISQAHWIHKLRVILPIQLRFSFIVAQIFHGVICFLHETQS
jgi:hypothetical protein